MKKPNAKSCVHNLFSFSILGDATGSKITLQDIRWVITVPAIWRQKAKQFMREAAYEAGIGGMSISKNTFTVILSKLFFTCGGI